MEYDGYRDRVEPGDDMVEEEARIVAAQDDTVWLEAESRPACGSCASDKSCGVGTFSKVISRKIIRFELPNDFNGSVGERVVVGIPQRALIKATVSAYLLPLVLMILIAVVAVEMGAGDGVTALASFAGLGLGLVLAHRLAGISIARGLRPQFLRRVGPPSGLPGQTA